MILLVFKASITNAVIQNDFKSLKKEFSKMNLPNVQLDFSNIFNSQQNLEDLSQKLLHINQVLLSSKNIETQNTCEMIEYKKLRFDLKLHKSRLQLLKNKVDNSESYNGSIYKLNYAKQWYQLLTLWWLGEDISPKELKAIGENEFELAYKQFFIKSIEVCL